VAFEKKALLFVSMIESNNVEMDWQQRIENINGL